MADYSLLAQNFSLLFYKESYQTIAGAFKPKDLYLLLGLWGFFFYIGIIKGYFKGGVKPFWKTRIIVKLAVYGFLVFSPFNLYDEFSVFIKNAHSYYFPPKSLSQGLEKFFKIEYPFVKEFKFAKAGERPHIFILPIESFNKNFVESSSVDGHEYMPFFNSIIKKGVYIENYYSNSIQTAKGNFAIYCSLLPLINGKVFVHKANTNFRCLPQVFKDLGYSTFFYRSHDQLSFDNTQGFLEKNGFDRVASIDRGRFTEQERREKIINWGPADDIFYREFFKDMDKLKGNKIFAGLQGVSTHHPFMVTKRLRQIYPDPKGLIQNYANAIREVDDALRYFFSELKKRKWLKNSLVIITGDHSFPMGEHGVTESDRGFYEEFFRVPMLMIWEGRLKPRRIKDRSFSHLDIAPTLINLLKINTKTHTLGVDIFGNRKTKNFLIQPYKGKYLGIVDFPFKYIIHQRSGKDYLFDLKKDPLEANNIVDEKLELVKSFKKDLLVFYANEKGIKENRIWPSSLSSFPSVNPAALNTSKMPKGR